MLVANATGHLNEQTAIGAQLFFWARHGYAIIYVFGIPWVRTLVWAISLAGTVMVLSQLF